MNRDDFAKQFVEEAQSRGKSKEDIMAVLPQALDDFDSQNSEGPLKSILKSKAIPVAGSVFGGGIGAIAGPLTGIAGAGVGYAGADVARKQLLNLLGMEGQPQAPMENLQDTAVPAAMASATQGAAVGAGKILPALLNPFKTVGKIRNYAFRNTQIPGNVLVQGGANIAKNAPEVYMDDLLGLAKNSASKYTGQTLDASKALSDAKKLGDVGWAAKSGMQIRGSDAYYSQEMQKLIKDELYKQSKTLGGKNIGKSADKVFSFLYNAPKAIQKATWLGLKATAIGKMIGL